MSFFSTLFLWSLVTVAVPVLIALWNRRKRRQEKFGGYYLLRRIAESTTRRIRLIELLKLINRILLVTFLILIFAEPYRMATRVGEADEGFVVLLDIGRSMQLKTNSGELLPNIQMEKLRGLLESFPSQSQGLVGFVGGRCEWADHGQGRQTGSPAEWLTALRVDRIPYENSRTETAALQTCLSRASSLFSGRTILRAFISPLPDSLDREVLEQADLHIETLPSPQIPREEKVDIQQSAGDSSIRITLASGGAQTASLIQGKRIEPLGILESSLDLPHRESSVLMLEGAQTNDLWGARTLFPLQSQSFSHVTLWAQKETPGYLSLLSALRNHPRIKVQKQIGGQPQGEAVIVYGSFPFATEGLQRAFFFLDPEGRVPFPVRDKKSLTSAYSATDLVRAFQFETPHGMITIRRYLLLDADRFETISSFQDGAPSLLRDRESEVRHWIAPFDLEDLTTDLTLEAAFIPYLYTQLDSWLQNSHEASSDQDYSPVYLYPGASKPNSQVIARLGWPGLYEAKGQVHVTRPVSLPNGFLSIESPEKPMSSREEQVSLRALFMKAMSVSLILELLFCLVAVPKILGFLLPLILLAVPVNALSVRPIGIAAWKGMDRDRLLALDQIAKESDRLSNLDFIKPVEASPADFWKYSIVFVSSANFGPLSDRDRQYVRDYCERGGLIVFDDSLAIADSQFYQSVKKELAAIFPQRELKSVSKEDVIFRTFYLLNEVSGRKLASPSIEGIQFDNRWIVLFSSNDLLGAIFRRATGDYGYSVTPYGVSQRMLAQRLLVNFLMYSVTIDYKDDAIHLPHILKRRVR